MEDMRKATIGELDPAQRAKEVQLQGGTDLDTTDLEKPAGLERSGGDLVREEGREYGPGDSATTEDPSAEDPFVPGTGEAPEDLDPDALLSESEKHLREQVKKDDPRGENGPSYEVHQGTNPRQDGGSTDPGNSG